MPVSQPSRNDRQRRVQLDQERFNRLAADPLLSPRAAAAARNIAGGARASVALLDEHLIRSLFPPHYYREARSLVAHLRRTGDASPERVEGMLRLAREVALRIDSRKPDHDLAPPPRLARLAAAPDQVDDHVLRIAQSIARSGGTPDVRGIILGLLRRGDGDPRDHVKYVAAALKRNGAHARIWRKLLWGENEFDGGATRFGDHGIRYGHHGLVGESYERIRGRDARELAIIRTLLARHHGIHGSQPSAALPALPPDLGMHDLASALASPGPPPANVQRSGTLHQQRPPVVPEETFEDVIRKVNQRRKNSNPPRMRRPAEKQVSGSAAGTLANAGASAFKMHGMRNSG